MARLQPVKLEFVALLAEWKARVLGWGASLRYFLTDANRRLHNLPQTNYDLGLECAHAGKLKDAIFRFKFVLWLAPQFTQAWYNLGCCQLADGQREKAVVSLKHALRLKSDHMEAKYMLAMIDPDMLAVSERPQRMPASMMEGFFARLAPTYDMLQGQARYAGPQLVHAAVHAKLGAAPARVLDMGCGTGLAARPWRKDATQIVGLDVVPEILELARKADGEGKPIYDALLTLDASAPHMNLPHGPFDLVLALHVLPYVGEATAFITHMAKAAAEGGMVALTFEPYNGQGGFGVVPDTSRFGHQPEYVKQLAAAAGLTLAHQEVVALYPEQKSALMCFTKAKAA